MSTLTSSTRSRDLTRAFATIPRLFKGCGPPGSRFHFIQNVPIPTGSIFIIRPGSVFPPLYQYLIYTRYRLRSQLQYIIIVVIGMLLCPNISISRYRCVTTSVYYIHTVSTTYTACSPTLYSTHIYTAGELGARGLMSVHTCSAMFLTAMFIYIYIHMYIYIYIYIGIYIYMCIYVYIYIYICIFIYVYVPHSCTHIVIGMLTFPLVSISRYLCIYSLSTHVYTPFLPLTRPQHIHQCFDIIVGMLIYPQYQYVTIPMCSLQHTVRRLDASMHGVPAAH
jgi:hypothetical protein